MTKKEIKMKQTTNKSAVKVATICETTGVVLTDTLVEARAFDSIEQIVIEREVWEDTAYRTSNEMLYGILDKCYRYYFVLKGHEGDDLAKRAKQDLELHINLRNYQFLKSTHLMTKIVKCVFNSQRRITSTYSLVLRVALSTDIKVDGVTRFIKENGGVHEISLNKGNSKTVVDKVAIVRSAIAESVFAEVNSEALGTLLNSAKAGQDLVIVATQLPNGGLALKAMTYNESAVKAALNAYYIENKKSLAGKSVERSQASNDDMITQSINKVA